MSRFLKDLDPAFVRYAEKLIARCVEAGIQVCIVDTLRTPEEHRQNLARGVSWTQHSLHLDGLAIDLAPWETWNLHGPDKLQWEADDPAWQKIGAIGEGLGLRWGGRFRPPAKPDLGHFELPLRHAAEVSAPRPA